MLKNRVGYEEFSMNETMNFMLNRLAWDVPGDILYEIGDRAQTLDDFTREMLAQAQLFESQSMWQEAAFCYRGAEFFLAPDDPQKEYAYSMFMKFFDALYPKLDTYRHHIDFRGGKLGVIDIPTPASKEKDVLLICNGYDGLIEELYTIALSLAEEGYRVVLFEGPGQGSALRWSHLPMKHTWEEPVAAVLDYFSIDACTLIGVSMGGYLAPRAAAFETRVKRLVAWGAMQDFNACLLHRVGVVKGAILTHLVHLGARSIVNGLFRRMMKKDEFVRWALRHGMHVSGQKDPFDFFRWTLDFNLDGVSHCIEQDTLLLMGTRDHVVPLEQLYLQMRGLTAARSLSVRVATEKEHGAQHCQVGNPYIPRDEIVRWLRGLENRDTQISSMLERY